MPEIAIPLLLLDHIEPIEPANSLLGGLEPLSVTSLSRGAQLVPNEQKGLVLDGGNPSTGPGGV